MVHCGPLNSYLLNLVVKAEHVSLVLVARDPRRIHRTGLATEFNSCVRMFTLQIQFSNDNVPYALSTLLNSTRVAVHSTRRVAFLSRTVSRKRTARAGQDG